MTITVLYCSPKHNTKYDDYKRFFKTLGHRFIAGGDYNAKNTFWGSRLTTTKGRELHKAMRNNNVQHLSTQPTFWPNDTNKLPDLLDFCIIKGIDTQKFTVESCLELKSDHTPILVTMFTHVLGKPNKPSLYNKHTDWNCFRKTLDAKINLEITLKTELDIVEAVANLTNAIQKAAWQATPNNQEHIHDERPTLVKQTLAEKRKARKRWQLTRAPHDKQRYNKLVKELKHLLRTLKNEGIQRYLATLTPRIIPYGKPPVR
jgi:hypothetical protein